MSLFSIAFSLFLLMDSIGNIPFYISFLKTVPPKRRSKIIVREMVIALFIILFFNFVGDALMHFLEIKHDTLQIAGGIILFLMCLKMIFPPPHQDTNGLPGSEPFIVPLAIPLVAGPAVLAAVMIYTRQEVNSVLMVGAILIAWAASLAILLSSSILLRFLGNKGVIALERLMGLILILIATQMFLTGLASFMNRSSSPLPNGEEAAVSPATPYQDEWLDPSSQSWNTSQSRLSQPIVTPHAPL